MQNVNWPRVQLGSSLLNQLLNVKLSTVRKRLLSIERPALAFPRQQLQLSTDCLLAQCPFSPRQSTDQEHRLSGGWHSSLAGCGGR